jgi:gliding motility-associated protein GldM
MGAKNCPETPRQQMIGMMYLVLTAMLALNVSKDILEAFNVVDDTLAQSNVSVKEGIDFKYAALAKDTTAKAKNANDKAVQLRQLSDGLVAYIENSRLELIKYVDGEKKAAEQLNDPANNGRIPVAKIDGKDNFDKPTWFYLRTDESGNDISENNPNCRASVMRAKINEYKSAILALLPDSTQMEKERKQFVSDNLGLEVDKDYVKGNGDNTTESWEMHNFNHLICAGTVILLSKVIGEVRNAEALVLDELTRGIDANDFKFDAVTGRAIPKSQIIFSGSNYESDIIVAAFNSSADLEVYYKIGADTLTEDQIGTAEHLVGAGGIAKLQIPAGGVGDHKFAGLIKVKSPDGYKYYGFRDTYSVIAPSATVAADKMNVLYAGIPNPVSIGGSVDVKRLSVSFPGCTMKATGDGKYDVTVPASLIGKKVTATVTARDGNSSKAMGSSEFRVKKVPDPTSYLGANIWGGKRSKSELLANPFISARMGDDFAYDLKWTIKSYRLTVISKGIEGAPKACSGGQFDGSVTSAINSASSGTVLVFSDIKASSIAGERTLRDITIRIK